MSKYARLTEAMESDAFPCNPVPFAKGLAEFVLDNGTSSITTIEAKRILWVLIAQAYGQMAQIDLVDEYTRLTR